MNPGTKQKKDIFDRLTLTRLLDDGGYYQGDKGQYLVKREQKQGSRIGTVILNRQYMTGIFEPKFDKKGLLFLGDYQGKMLSFVKTGTDQITVYMKHKKNSD